MDLYRILIVDDSSEILRMLSVLLQDRYEIILAQDGIIGYQKAISYLPDLVILDITMPRMSGYQFIEQMNQVSELKNTPVIFYSAKTSAVDQAYGLKKGASAYIPKPSDPDLILEQIEKLLMNVPLQNNERPDYNQVMTHEKSGKDRNIYWTG